MPVPSHPAHVAAVHSGAQGMHGTQVAHAGAHAAAGRVSQRTNTPDFNLERDIIGPTEMELEEIALGMETAELDAAEQPAIARARPAISAPRRFRSTSSELGVPVVTGAVIPIIESRTVPPPDANDSRFKINLSTILISALLFLMVLAWFDFIQSAFYDWVGPEYTSNDIPPSIKFWYALGITIIILILVYLIFYHMRDVVH